MYRISKSRSNIKRTPAYYHSQAFYHVSGKRPNRGGWWESPLVTPYQGSKVTNSSVITGWNGRKTEFHTVYHEKVNYSWSPVSYSVGPAPGADLTPEVQLSDDNYSLYKKGYLYDNWPQAPNGTSLVPGRPAIYPLPLDWRKCYESLLDDAHGLMPAQKSLAVNVAEFTQVKRLVPGIAKSISNILRWVKRQPNGRIKVRATRLYRGRRRSFYKTVDVRAMRWTLRDLSQLHLANQFGVQPLASDLGELAGKLWEVKMHQNWWKTMTDGRYHTIHASVTAQHSSSSQITTPTKRWGVAEEFKQTTRGTLGARVLIKPVTEEIAQRRLFQQIIGWNVPLQIVWELVPFSFVVDWFVPVGDVLSRFEPKRFFGSLAAGVIVQHRWHSIRSEAESSRKLYARDQSYGGSYPQYDPRGGLVWMRSEGGGVAKLTVYERSELWPDFNFMPPRGSFGLKQAGLSFALVVARLFK